ncbi:MAG: hypothetical protein KAS92_05655 [Candidatus Omnitrophica bacterium]|nr:hypothetical protein [Candidatus Omnitrophota bacterium]
MSVPYFYAKINAGSIRIEGQIESFLGHEISRNGNVLPDGVFAKWSWDGKTLMVENDRYGFYPLYYYCSGKEICVSSSIDQILNKVGNIGLDYVALSVFLRLGFFIGEETPFQSIRALPPQAHFEWCGGQLSVNGNYIFGKKSAALSKARAMDQFQELFEQSIKRRLPKGENFVMPLSGGRDSRHILFELMRLGCVPESCVSFRNLPPISDEDVKIAKLISEKLNIKHYLVEQTSTYSDMFMRNMPITNYCSDEHFQMLEMADYLRGKTQIIYDGIGGDVLSAGLFLNEQRLQQYRSGQYEQLSADLLGREILNLRLNKEFYKKVSVDIATVHLVEELKKYKDEPNPVGSFYFWNRTRREVALAPYRIFGNIATVYSPYLDHEVYDFLSTLDASLLLDHTFHTETIERAYPQYASIPFEDKNVSGGDPSHVRKRLVRDCLVYAIKNITSFVKLMRVGYVIPRLLYSIVTGVSWWICPSILYLIKLNEFCGQKFNDGK